MASVRLAGRDGGRLEAKAQAPMVWDANAIPTLTDDRNASVSLAVDRFRLKALEPFVQGSVNRLDGTLDGEVRLGLGAQAGFSGEMRLEGGVVQVATIGQPFENASFRVAASPSGEPASTTSAPTQATARSAGTRPSRWKGSRSGTPAPSFHPERPGPPDRAGGRPDGRGARPGGARGGEAGRGRSPSASTCPRSISTLPPTIGRSVQPLGENADITTSAPLSQKDYEARRAPAEPPEQAKQSAGGTPIAMEVHLGRIGVEGDMVQASLSGDRAHPLRIKVAGETEIRGNVNIVSTGRLEVLGKEFEIEPGVVALQGDPSNPFLNVRAYHDTPEGTRIFIDYVGQLNPITEDKITFRSEPPRPENQVIAELLLGREFAEGTLAGGTSAGQPSGSGGGRRRRRGRGQRGDGLASAQLNMILQSIGPLRTSRRSWARPKKAR